MDLSVIIVNYNVRYYLEQCISSVAKAIEGMEAEVFVVDNNSGDGSMEMVAEKFPWVKAIANKENVGFSRANNQALEVSKGRYALLLNPDTVVAENAFKLVVDFMDAAPNAGGVGVRMIDGKGKFLPESKRGLPTPMVALFKITGFSSLFPKSKLFAKYHLGHLDEHEVNEIEILSGASMFLRKSTLDKVGLLDNNFFMYGEDIDLSYRITLGGYKNYYFPEAQLIHYKGESTKKGSFNYVYVFYNAMAIFARKHFTKKGSGLFAMFINMAIYASAGAALLARTIRKLILPITDAVVLIGGVLVIEHLLLAPPTNGAVRWQLFHLVCLFTWILSITLMGGYDKPIRIWNIVKGTILGSVIIVFASLASSDFFLQALPFIGMATVWTFITFSLSRVLLHVLRVDGYSLKASNKERFLVIGSKEESKRVSDLIWQLNFGIGGISTLEPSHKSTLAEMNERVISEKVDTVVFCAKDISDKQIINMLQRIKRFGLEFKIARPNCEFLIGSHSIASQKDLFILDLNSVRVPKNKRNKRLLDIGLSLLLLASLPITIWPVKEKGQYIGNLFKVLFGKSSWVGYQRNTPAIFIDLPKLKQAIIAPSMNLAPELRNTSFARRTNVIYAKNYSVWNDLKLVLGNIPKLGGRA